MPKKSPWETLDTEAVLAKQRAQVEATTTANVGAYPVPLGQPLRRAPPPVRPNISLERLANDPEYRRALKAMGWID